MKLLTKVWSKLVRYGWKNNKVWLGKVWNMADNLGRGVGWILGAGRFLMGWIYGVWGS